MKDLKDLRLEINDIDREIIELFVKRSDVVRRVKILKDSQTHDAQSFALHIRPDREFDVVTNALKLSEKAQYSHKFFFHTWRGVIAASNFLEQGLNLIATCEISKHSLYEYYAMQSDVTMVETQTAFAQVEHDEFHILAFHGGNSHAFEILKKSEKIRIFAQSANSVFLCGKVVNPNFEKPAMAVSLVETQNCLNQNAGVYASYDLTQSHLGAFYEYPI